MNDDEILETFAVPPLLRDGLRAVAIAAQAEVIAYYENETVGVPEFRWTATKNHFAPTEHRCEFYPHKVVDGVMVFQCVCGNREKK